MTEASNVDGRSRERYRRARLAVALGGFERIATALAGALRVALLIRSLGVRDYGLYLAVFGIVGTANLLDFGLHYGVLTEISRASGKDDFARVRAALSTAFLLYAAIAIAATLALWPILQWGPIGWIFGLAPDQVATARLIALLGFGSLLLSMPTKVATAGLVGMQRAYLASAYRTVSTLVQLAVLLVSLQIWPGQLLPLVAAASVFDTLIAFGLLVWVTRTQPELRLSFASASKELARPLLATGMTFLLTNLANVFRRSLATVVIAHSLGTAAVPAFSVPFALFTIALGFSETISSSLWPAYGEAAARGDWPWVARAYRLGTRAALAAGLFFATLGVAGGDEVIRVWSSRVVNVSVPVLAWFALWLVSQVATHSGATLLNGLGKNRVVLVVVACEGLLTLGASVFAVRSFGVVGVIATMAMGGVLGALGLQALAIPRSSGTRIKPEWMSWTRLVAVGITATGTALLAQRPLLGGSTIARLFTATAVASGTFIALLSVFALTSAERARVWSWLRARVPHTTKP